ncbi:MAG: hypothetical protein J5990_13255 [Bacteroidales bacterium]|nr:hypothetical protein [Bacteroidales bacterium]
MQLHGNKYISALARLWLAAIVPAVMSCNEEVIFDRHPETGMPDAENAYEVEVNFNISDPDAYPGTKVDQKENWTVQTGSDAENKINNIYLFAVDYDSETGEETVEEVVKADLVPGDFTANGVNTGHTFKLSSGVKRFYVGANMTEAHVSAFCNKENMMADSYESALAMVMDGYDTKSGDGTNILMLSDPATDVSGNTEIDITQSRFISISARLERLVSKVMVVADYDGTATPPNGEGRTGEAINYLKSNTLNGFFIDFQFILNNTNKALNVAKVYDEATRAAEDTEPRFNIDPNWNLTEWVRYDDDTGSVISSDIQRMNENFSFWSDSELEERFYTPATPKDFYSNNLWWCSNIPASSGSDATDNIFDYNSGDGLYCLENTVFDDGFNTSYPSADKVKAAFITTTYVYLRARFIPIRIIGDYDGNDMNGTAPTADEYTRIFNLFWQTERPMGEGGKYPYTFYIDKEKGRHFTYTGANRWISNPATYTKSDGSAWTWSDFEPYIGGWVYFKTFFEEGGKDNQDGIITYEGLDYWGIRRNDYCLLTIKQIENWGEADLGNSYIKVKSETVPWVKRGSSDITVTPE